MSLYNDKYLSYLFNTPFSHETLFFPQDNIIEIVMKSDGNLLLFTKHYFAETLCSPNGS